MSTELHWKRATWSVFWRGRQGIFAARIATDSLGLRRRLRRRCKNYVHRRGFAGHGLEGGEQRDVLYEFSSCWRSCSPLTALLANAALEVGGDDGPVRRSHFRDESHQLSVFFGPPCLLHHACAASFAGAL